MLKDVSSFFFLFFWAQRVRVAPSSYSDVTHVSLPSTGLRNGCAGRSKWHVESLRVSRSSSGTLLLHCPAVTHRVYLFYFFWWCFVLPEAPFTGARIL